MEKTWCMVLTEKALWLQWNIPPWFIIPLEKSWFNERLVFKMIMVRKIIKVNKR